MLKRLIAICLFCSAASFLRCTSEKKNTGVAPVSSQAAWPDSLSWWTQNNLRVMQANLPAYEAALNADSLVADLLYFSANVLIINAGGIMAFTPQSWSINTRILT